MLKLIIPAVGIFICSGIFGQGQPTIKLIPEKQAKDSPVKKKSFNLPYSINPKDLNQITGLSASPDLPKDTARYSHSTPNGMVYILPGSNMPMLKPNMGNLVMPGTFEIENSFIPKQGQIPNGLLPRVMVFEKPPGK